MTVFEFEYASVSVEDSVPEWVIHKIEWVPIHENDKESMHTHYSSESTDYRKCTKWLFMLVENGDSDDGPEVSAMPCASDGSSPCDTSFIYAYGEHKWDEMIQDARNGTLCNP